MSKVNLLFDVVSDMRSLADSIQAVCTAIAENEPEKKSHTVISKEKEKQPDITLEDVRAVLADKSRLGKTVQVRELIQKYGADKLSEVPQTYYTDILKDAEAL